MLRGEESPMDFEYSSQEMNSNCFVEANKQIRSTHFIKQDLNSLSIPFVTSPFGLRTNAGDLLISNKFQNQRKKEHFNFNGVKVIDTHVPSKDVISPKITENTTRTKAKEAKLIKDEDNNSGIPNKKRKRTRELYCKPERDQSFDTPKTSLNHYHLPMILSGYLQFFFSLFLISILGYICLQIILTVHHDLQIKVDEYAAEITQQIAECSKQYTTNKCHPHERIPAIEKLCGDWETCMMRDPKVVGRLKVGAETFAEILNNLVDPLSYKTLVFGTLLFLATLFMSLSTFQSLRNGNADRKSKDVGTIKGSGPVVFNLHHNGEFSRGSGGGSLASRHMKLE